MSLSLFSPLRRSGKIERRKRMRTKNGASPLNSISPHAAFCAILSTVFSRIPPHPQGRTPRGLGGRDRWHFRLVFAPCTKETEPEGYVTGSSPDDVRVSTKMWFPSYHTDKETGRNNPRYLPAGRYQVCSAPSQRIVMYTLYTTNIARDIEKVSYSFSGILFFH